MSDAEPVTISVRSAANTASRLSTKGPTSRRITSGWQKKRIGRIRSPISASPRLKNFHTRTLIGSRTFRIQQVREGARTNGKSDPLFDAQGEPKKFNYLNIYSEAYIRWVAATLPGAGKVTLREDRDFDPAALGPRQWPGKNKPADITQVANGWQVNHYVLQPWCFLGITRKPE
jgi:hypothetical protein